MNADSRAEAVDRRPRTAAGNQAFIKDQVKSLIISQDLHPGDPLPTEQQLMSQLGVGRHPLREAMKALEAVGIIEIRHGYGTYVGSLSLRSLEDGLVFRMNQSMTGDLHEVRNVLDVREALEIGMADRVIDHYRGTGLDQLTEIVETMEDMATRNEQFPEQDLEFHRVLYAPLDNALIIDLLSVFWRAFADVDSQLPGDHYTPTDAARWHRNLLEAIRSDSAGGFTNAMKDHFTGIRVRFAESGH